MPIGTSTGQNFDSELDLQARPLTKVYIGPKPGDNTDLSSAGAGSVAATMPLGSPTEPAGALKPSGGSQVPARLSIINSIQGMANPSFDEDKQILSGLYETAKNAFSLPGDVFAGKVPAGSTQEIERAADLAGLMVTGPAPVASKMADGTLGSFMGVKSKTINKDALYKAQTLEMDGVHPDDIWSQTGTFRGADGRWRQEIPDNTASLNTNKLSTSNLYEGYKVPESWGDVSGSNVVSVPPSKTNFFGQTKNPLTMGDVLDHPDLYKAYPDLAKVPVLPMPLGFTAMGMTTGKAIHMSPMSPDNFKSILLHEAQHMIQNTEGFARGGSKSEFTSPQFDQAMSELADIKSKVEPEIAKQLGDLPLSHMKQAIRNEQEGNLKDLPSYVQKGLEVFKKNNPESYSRLSNIVASERLLDQHHSEAFDMYERLMGEVEARNVQARAALNRIQLQRTPPIQSEDVARPQQIMPGSGRSMSASDTGLDPIHLQSPEAARFRLGQLLRDKAASKKAGEDVEGSDYMFYNSQIRKLREYLRSAK